MLLCNISERSARIPLRVCVLLFCLQVLAASVPCGAAEAAGTETLRSSEYILLSSENRGGYECLHISYEAAGDSVRAYLLVPDSAAAVRCPAVLMLHDHGARFDIGKEKLVRPAADAPGHIRSSSEQWAEKYFDGIHMADSLAASGYVVLVPDALYWGERSSADAQLWSELVYGDSLQRVAALRKAGGNAGTVGQSGTLRCGDASLMAGRVLSGRMPSGAGEVTGLVRTLKNKIFEGQRTVYDSLSAEGAVWAEKTLQEDIASASFLASLPFVDRERVGAFGFSMGAHRCWLLAAFSGDVKCGAAVCWMMMKRDYDASSPSDLSMRIPRLREEYDFPEIARLTYPRPMLFVSGRQDPLFPERSVAEAFEKMQDIYCELSENSGGRRPASGKNGSCSGECGCLHYGTVGKSENETESGAGRGTYTGICGKTSDEVCTETCVGICDKACDRTCDGSGRRTGMETVFVDGGHHCGLPVQHIVLDFFTRCLN